MDHGVALVDEIGLFLGVGYFGEKDNVFLIGVWWEKIVEVDEDEIIIGELSGYFLNGFVDVFNIKTVFAAVAAEDGCGLCGWYVGKWILCRGGKRWIDDVRDGGDCWGVGTNYPGSDAGVYVAVGKAAIENAVN